MIMIIIHLLMSLQTVAVKTLVVFLFTMFDTTTVSRISCWANSQVAPYMSELLDMLLVFLLTFYMFTLLYSCLYAMLFGNKIELGEIKTIQQ